MTKINRYGWRRQRLDRRDRKFSLAPGGVVLPESVDWSAKMPPVYRQEFQDCTANAIAGVVQFLQGQQGEPLVMPSRLFIYYNERALEGSTDDDGAEIRDGIKSLVSQGVCPESDWSYGAGNVTVCPPHQCYDAAVKEELLQYESVDNTHLNTLLQALTIGPVVGGFTVYENFESDLVAITGKLGMPDETKAPVGGHAVVFVGFDTNAQTVKVRNSWGWLWGRHGYFDMPFAYVTDPALASDFWLCRRMT